MQQRKTVEDYLNSVIPEKIPISIKSELRAELESHIYDKADFYMEIGYDEQAAFNKAVEEMGEAVRVRKEFDELYCEKGIYSVATFIVTHILDAIAIVAGMGGAVFTGLLINADGFLNYSYDSLIISCIFVCAAWILVIWSYKEKKVKMLKSVALSNLIFSIFPWFCCSVYYPFAYRLTDMIFNISESFSDIRFYVSELVSVPLCMISFVLFLIAEKKKFNIESTSKNGKKARIVYVGIVLCFIIFMVFHNVSVSNKYDNYNFFFISEYAAEKDKEKYAENESEVFDYINGNMSFEQVDDFLRQRGYVPHTDFYKYIENEEEFEYQLGYMKEKMVDVNNDILYINLSHYKTPYWYLSSIVVPKTQDKTISYKKINYDINSLSLDKGKKSKEVFKSLNKGDEKETVLKLMNKSYSLESKKAEYENNEEAEIYYFSSEYDNSDLFYYDTTYFNAELVFKNSSLIKGKCSSQRYYQDEDYEQHEKTHEYVIEN